MTPRLAAAACLALATGMLAAAPASAFCGFFVAKADADLFNSASRVVYVRDGDRSVITMVNDYEGDPSEFAMVIPTPVVLERGQINVGETAVVDHLDAYTAPRLVEYFDTDPCAARPELLMSMRGVAASAPVMLEDAAAAAAALGVTVEAEYTVGEYDIVLLSARDSNGLVDWLNLNGYRTPESVLGTLALYIRQGMKFFVAKVNLAEHDRTGGAYLRPLQIAFESEDFTLPIRLGMANANGPQDLILYTLTRTGRVETVNYPTVKMPSDVEVPLFVKDDFAEAYRAAFGEITKREGGSAVVMEYAWDMAWCDPCAADPLTSEQLRSLGVFWAPRSPQGPQGRIAPMSVAQDVFVTRLHARYDSESFREDLRLRETRDRENFQGRYILRHPFEGDLACPAGEEYIAGLPHRFDLEAEQLANLTGWDITEIRARMKAGGQDPEALAISRPWWETIWEQ